MNRNYVSFQCFEKTWFFLYKKRLVVTDDLSCEKTTVQKRYWEDFAIKPTCHGTCLELSDR